MGEILYAVPMQLESRSPYPMHRCPNGIPTNLYKNLTPTGRWQVARVLTGGGASADYEILFNTASEEECDRFLYEQIEKDYPGLLTQHD
jgi:hypothetical protein